jgi:hypothetical protein
VSAPSLPNTPSSTRPFRPLPNPPVFPPSAGAHSVLVCAESINEANECSFSFVMRDRPQRAVLEEVNAADRRRTGPVPGERPPICWNEGHFVASYKFARLLAVADVAVEAGDDSGAALPVTVLPNGTWALMPAVSSSRKCRSGRSRYPIAEAPRLRDGREET